MLFHIDSASNEKEEWENESEAKVLVIFDGFY